MRGSWMSESCRTPVVLLVFVAPGITGGLQGTIRYRNIRITELPAGAAKDPP